MTDGGASMTEDNFSSRALVEQLTRQDKAIMMLGRDVATLDQDISKLWIGLCAVAMAAVAGWWL